ncbi:MAG: hypothetical protein E7256_00450 [Lachnospiraceae bacterium]|nr:hypothetical protein [Lachnospiraceae bacterium]
MHRMMEKIAGERNVTMNAVMQVNQTCLSLLVGTLLLVIRKRRENDEDMILNQLRDSLGIIIDSIRKP